MDRFRTTMTVSVLCGITLYVILHINSLLYETEIKTIQINAYQRPMNSKFGTIHTSNLPLCGLGQNSFIFSVPNRKKLGNVSTIFRDTPKHLCMSRLRKKDSTILTMSDHELFSYDKCRKDNSNPLKVQQMNNEFKKDFRLKFFDHLKDKKHSSVIEIGGYKGNLTQSFLEKYKIQHYVVVEPMRTNYEHIISIIKSLQRSDVGVYQFGLGNEYAEIPVHDQADGTSLLSYNSTGNLTVQVVNAIDFFLFLGVACHDIDLLTMNCEGCEFDVLEMLVSANLIDRFVHIQFQPHCVSREALRLGDCPCRYCRIRQLLERTHEVGYRFTHIWETWRRKPRY